MIIAYGHSKAYCLDYVDSVYPGRNSFWIFHMNIDVIYCLIICYKSIKAITKYRLIMVF